MRRGWRSWGQVPDGICQPVPWARLPRTPGFPLALIALLMSPQAQPRAPRTTRTQVNHRWPRTNSGHPRRSKNVIHQKWNITATLLLQMWVSKLETLTLSWLLITRAQPCRHQAAPPLPLRHPVILNQHPWSTSRLDVTLIFWGAVEHNSDRSFWQYVSQDYGLRHTPKALSATPRAVISTRMSLNFSLQRLRTTRSGIPRHCRQVCCVEVRRSTNLRLDCFADLWSRLPCLPHFPPSPRLPQRLLLSDAVLETLSSMKPGRSEVGIFLLIYSPKMWTILKQVLCLKDQWPKRHETTQKWNKILKEILFCVRKANTLTFLQRLELYYN